MPAIDVCLGRSLLTPAYHAGCVTQYKPSQCCLCTTTACSPPVGCHLLCISLLSCNLWLTTASEVLILILPLVALLLAALLLLALLLPHALWLLLSSRVSALLLLLLLLLLFLA